jgi:hypothetical protein
MNISCPFTPGKQYRVCREFGAPLLPSSVGEIVRFDAPLDFAMDDDPAIEWVMFSFTSDSHSLPRLWQPQDGETIDSWPNYFEELSS